MSESLFAAVYVDPLNDQPRAALAAALTKAGDPRGAFIATQLAQARGERVPKDEAAQARADVKAHGREWLAPLTDRGVIVASTVRWERGFPYAGRLNLSGSWADGLRDRDSAAPHPLADVQALATLRSLKLCSPNSMLADRHAEAIVMLRQLRWLRELIDVPRRSLVKLAAAKPPFHLERVKHLPAGGGGLSGEKQEMKDRLKLDEAFATARGLPQLRDLDLSWSHGRDAPADYRWLFDTELGARLEVLRLEGYYLSRELPPWLDALDVAPHLALRELNVHHGHFTISVRREDGGRWSQLSGKVLEHRYGDVERELTDLLAAVGRDRFTTIGVEGFTL